MTVTSTASTSVAPITIVGCTDRVIDDRLKGRETVLLQSLSHGGQQLTGLIASLLKRSLAAAAALALGGSMACAGSPPLIFLHMSADRSAWFARLLSGLTQPCGAHIDFPWSAVETSAGVYDWTAVEKTIAPWVAQHKTIGLTFAGVDEEPGQTTGSPSIPATPAYVLAQTPTITCTGLTRNGVPQYPPPTPVYWNSGYAVPWRAFIQAAVQKYQNDSRIAYMRFGVGVGGESYLMNGLKSSQACVAQWEAAGMSYSAWVANALSIVDFVGAMKPNKPIFFGLNGIKPWDPSPLAFGKALAAEANKYGFYVGSAGYNGTLADFNAVYARYISHTYMQTKDDQITSGLFPNIVTLAERAGVPVWEIYPEDFMNQTTAPLLAALGNPQSCAIGASGALQPVASLAPVAIAPLAQLKPVGAQPN